MPKLTVHLLHQPQDGELITIKTPAASDAVDGLRVYETEITDTTATESHSDYTIVDAAGNDLGGVGGVFIAGAYLTFAIDKRTNKAYIQNPASSYGDAVEETFTYIGLTFTARARNGVCTLTITGSNTQTLSINQTRVLAGTFTKPQVIPSYEWRNRPIFIGTYFLRLDVDASGNVYLGYGHGIAEVGSDRNIPANTTFNIMETFVV